MERYSKPLDPDTFTLYESSHKQRVFYGHLHDTEVFYGGAIGGGKSDAILKAALQYVHVPGYSALVLRRVEDDLGYLVDRLFLWLSNTDATWNGSEKRWMWPNGAYIKLGGCKFEATKFKYQGHEYQYIGFDELTQFTESQYEFIRTRLRHQECTIHKGGDFEPSCGLCRAAYVNSYVPLRVRGASNPDNIGRLWVKRRFISEQAEQDIEDGCPKDSYIKGEHKKNGPVFIPSRASDNPGIDDESYYETSVSHLRPGIRAQLWRGSWRVVEGAILKQEWYRYYRMAGDILIRQDQNGEARGQIDARDCKRFATVDTASTSTEEMKRKKLGKEPSWSVFAVWDLWVAERCLFLRHIWRDRVDWNALKAAVHKNSEDWLTKSQPQIIENANCGKQLGSEMNDRGWAVEMFNPNQQAWKGQSGTPGKLDRSTTFQTWLEDGRVFLPQYASWLADLEGEWVAWTGDPDDPADQVDVSSMAAIHADGGHSVMVENMRGLGGSNEFTELQAQTGRIGAWGM